MQLAAFPIMIGRFDGWEIFLIAAIILCLFGARRLPNLIEGLRRGMEEFVKATSDVSKDLRRPKFSFELWLAQGFFVGRIPIMPGTFGSLVGLLWFMLLLTMGNFWLYLLGSFAGIGLSILFCDAAEKILGEKDPGSVVLDEIAALPVCFLAWVGILHFKEGFLPEPGYFFSPANWPLTLGVFTLFRFFDVVKPWPVRQSQSLPGGWGVTVDDVLAAIYVNLVALLVYAGKTVFSHPG